ncbi:MAG: ATP-binding protein [candidate division Zixibacteria bacterium]|nr:ATP-binding protein [candidate division Zixibacteria bacterium]
MNTKSTAFRFEIGLGLALIILVLVILNFASHYALFRIEQSLHDQIEDELSEAAVVTANAMFRFGGAEFSDSLIDHIKYDYTLESLSIVPLHSNRVIAIQRGDDLDPELQSIDSTLTTRDLLPILQTRTIYRHKKGNAGSTLLFPTEYAGSKYIIIIAKNSALLSSVENAGRTLIFFGFLGLVIIVYIASRFMRFVTDPFNRLKEKAKASGRLDLSAGDEMTQLIQSYERIIDDLKIKEQELVYLNELITRRAESLEIYNNYILKSIHTGVITFNNEKEISTINDAAMTILNIPSIDYAGKGYLELLKDYAGLISLVEKFISTGSPIDNRSIRITTAQKDPITMVVSLSHLTDSQGNIIGLALILNDQTDLSKLQQELELNRRMASLGEMSGGLAHQLRNSTAAIVGFGKMISKKAEKDNPIRENIRLLLDEAIEASELVARFLDFAQPLNLVASEFDIKELIENVVALTRGKYNLVEFRIDYKHDSGLIGWGDQLLLKQAIGNIVDNACHAVEGGNGLVQIKIINTAKAIKISIADNGPGIPDDYKDKIFTPFFSGSPSGSGLGLPLARKIITLHEGRVEYSSRAGKGTIFTITLPLSKTDRQARQLAKTSAS